MADPLSVASGVAGLISLAEVVARGLYKYVRGVKGAKNEINTLIDETSTLYGLLQRLALIPEVIEKQSHFQTIPLPFISSCWQTLKAVESELGKYQTSASHLKWPLISSSKVKELIQGIERQKTALSLALQANEAVAIFKQLGMTDEMRNDILQIRTLLEARTRIKLTKEKQRILNSYSTLTPLDKYEAVLSLRHPGTCLWLNETDEFKHWMETPNTGLWLYGIPGAGKTVLAAAAIDQAVKITDGPEFSNALAYFFCDYKEAATLEPANIIASLIRQLARQDERCFAVAEEYHISCVESRGQWKLPSAKNLCDIFLEMAEFFDCAMVIIDGVDECGETQSDAAELIARLIEHPQVKALILSRDQQEIRKELDSFEKLSITAETSDIELYVASEIAQRTASRKLLIQDPSLKKEILEKLTKGAQGMFRWVACQMDHLCGLPTDARRRAALQSLPPTLYGSYERILEEINEKSELSQALVQRAFRWIFQWPGYRIPIEALCEAVSIEENATSQVKAGIPHSEEIVRLCGSFVRVSRGLIEPAHVSVKEFLNSAELKKKPKFAPYHLDDERDRIDVARTMIRYLCFEDFNGSLQVELEESQYPLRKSIFQDIPWLFEAHPPVEKPFWNPTLLNDARALFNSNRLVVFVSFATTYFRHFFKKILPKNRSGSEYIRGLALEFANLDPLHFAAFVRNPDLCLALLESGSDPTRKADFGSPIHWLLLGELTRSTDKEENSSLHLSRISAYDREIAVSFLRAGVDPNSAWSYFGDFESRFDGHTVTDWCVEGAWNLLPDIYSAGARFEVHHFERLLSRFSGPEGPTPTSPSRSELEQLKDLLRPFLQCIVEDRVEDESRSLLLKLELICSPSTEAKVLPEDSAENFNRKREMVFVAVEYGQVSVVQELLEDDKIKEELPTLKDKSGRPLLCLAALQNNAKIVEVLLRNGVDPNVGDAHQQSPVHVACRRGAVECVREILAAGGQLSQPDDLGRVAWHAAAYSGQLPLVRFLAQQPNGKESFRDCRANDGQTPIHYAIMGGDLDVIQYLLDLNDNIDVTDQHGCGLFHVLLGSHDDIGFRRFVSNGERIIKLLHDRGYSLSAADDEGLDALSRSMISKWPQWDLIKILIEKFPVEINLETRDGYRRTLLMIAVRFGQLEVCEWLIDQGIELDAVAEDNSTALLEAVKSNELDIVKKLLAHGVDVNCRNLLGETPLLRACENGYVDIVELLLEHSPDLTARDYAGRDSACRATAANSVRILKLLDAVESDYAPAPKAEASWIHEHPLHVAVKNKSYECLEYLLNSGRDVNNTDWLRQTPLHVAAGQGDMKAATILLSHGAQIDATDWRRGSTAQKADQNGHSELAERLKALAEAQTPSGFQNQLKKAIVTGSLSWCRRLAENKVDLDSPFVGKCKCRPITFALMQGEMYIASFLLERNVNLRGAVCRNHRYHGWSLIHLCVWRNELAFLKRLLSHDSTLMNDPFLVHPLHTATAYNRTEIASVLLTGLEGVMRPCDVDVPMGDRDYSLYPESESTLPEGVIDEAAEYYDVNDLPDAPDKNGYLAAWLDDPAVSKGATALHIACYFGNLDMSRLLIQHHANINATASFLYTPLHFAAGLPAAEMTKLLLSHGAEMDVQDCLLQTPLMIAISMGREGEGSYIALTDAGADLSLARDDGQEAVHMAANIGHPPALAYLWSRGASLLPTRNNRWPAGCFGFASGEPRVYSFLLNCGMDFSICSPDEGSVLHGIIYNQNASPLLLRKVMKRIEPGRLAQLVNFNALIYGTVLYMAARANKSLHIPLLIDAGADINAVGGPDGTALMGASRAGRVEAVRALMNAGARVVVWNDGETLSAVRAARKRPAVLRWFLVTRFTEVSRLTF